MSEIYKHFLAAVPHVVAEKQRFQCKQNGDKIM